MSRPISTWTSSVWTMIFRILAGMVAPGGATLAQTVPLACVCGLLGVVGVFGVLGPVGAPGIGAALCLPTQQLAHRIAPGDMPQRAMFELARRADDGALAIALD